MCRPDGSFCNTKCAKCERRMLHASTIARKRELARLSVLQGTNRKFI